MNSVQIKPSLKSNGNKQKFYVTFYPFPAGTFCSAEMI